eukprot:GILJ01012205.1.p1 GENE.GILJ01012205.1~~GILJ01012205.1.p1  ORF type:complete len:542 (+),score=51.88 GILJ01012205.1:26-1627(+)
MADDAIIQTAEVHIAQNGQLTDGRRRLSRPAITVSTEPFTPFDDVTKSPRPRTPYSASKMKTPTVASPLPTPGDGQMPQPSFSFSYDAPAVKKPAVYARSATEPVLESPKPATRKQKEAYSLFSFLDQEISFHNVSLNNERLSPEAIYHFLFIPLRLEKLLSFGFFVCLDSFLYLFTMLPLRAVMAIYHLIRGKQLHTSLVCDLLRVVLMSICVCFLGFIDVSRAYHYIRGQAIIKLYVVFNMLEIFDKLCASFGHDILDTLWRSASKPSWRLLFDFFISAIYIAIHSLVVFAQVVTFNVAINSSSNSLLTLLISNNFVELKGSVFKKFERQNLFQISCNDIVERFQLFIYVILIGCHSIFTSVQESWDLVGNLLTVAVSLWTLEAFVDWIKHAFITKFNSISHELYMQMRAVLLHDITSCRNPNERSRPALSGILDHSHAVSRRVGFIDLPLASLCICMCGPFLSPYGPLRLHVLTLLLLFLCLCAIKILLGILLLGYACKTELKIVADEEAKKSDGLFNISPYALWKAKRE